MIYLLTLYLGTRCIVGGESERGKMRIGEAAAEAGVSTQTLRFYERRGLLKKPARSASGYRVYSPEAVRLVRFIRQSQELGCTLGEIARLIELRERRTGNAAEVRAMVEARLRSIDDRIERLQRMRAELSSLMDECPCGGEQSRCPALEAFDHYVAGA